MTGVNIAEGSEKLIRKKTPLCSQLATEHFLYFELYKWKQPKYGQVIGKIISQNKAVFLMKGEHFIPFLNFYFQKS